MKKNILILMSSMLLTTSLYSMPKEDIKDTITNKINNVIELIKEEKTSKINNEEKIYSNLDEVFDFPLMPKIVLGKERRNYSSSELKEFDTNFVKFIKNYYYNKFKLYEDQKIYIGEIDYSSSKRIIVPTFITNEDEDKKYQVTFKLRDRNKNNDWLIYDVEIENVSVIVSNKVQVKESLNLDKDLKKLIEKLNSND